MAFLWCSVTCEGARRWKRSVAMQLDHQHIVRLLASDFGSPPHATMAFEVVITPRTPSTLVPRPRDGALQRHTCITYSRARMLQPLTTDGRAPRRRSSTAATGGSST